MFEALGFTLQKSDADTGHLVCDADASFDGANIVKVSVVTHDLAKAS
jgi:hypothetical protein